MNELGPEWIHVLVGICGTVVLSAISFGIARIIAPGLRLAFWNLPLGWL
jgi:hypothetical protein